jgi:hypothetical protein
VHSQQFAIDALGPDLLLLLKHDEMKRNLSVTYSRLAQIVPLWELLVLVSRYCAILTSGSREREEKWSRRNRDNCCDSLLLLERSCNVHKHDRAQYTCLRQMSPESTVSSAFDVHRLTVRTVSFILKWERDLRWIFLRLPIGIFLLSSTNEQWRVRQDGDALAYVHPTTASLATTTITICENEGEGEKRERAGITRQ